MKAIRIGNHCIGKENPTFIIAEAGVNHNGDVSLAKELIKEAHQAGAHAVKFQAFTARGLCNLDLTETKNVEGLTGGSKSSYDMYKRLELSEKDIQELLQEAQHLGIDCFFSVFDEVRVQFLDTLDTCCFKISSGDLTYIPLIKKAAHTGRPIILSSGLGTLDEIRVAVSTIEATGNAQIIILQCTADYPPRDEEINLAVIEMLQKTFDYPIGFSDHSLGIEIPLAAAALGATVIEKHFTVSHDCDGPDHEMSLDPTEFKQMVAGIRRIEKARGSSVKMPTPKEATLVFSGRRGIKAARDISAGEILTDEDIIIVKPESGINPEHKEDIIGKKVLNAIKRNEPIEWETIKGDT